MAGAAPQNRNNSLSVPWSDTVRFIRQLSHDLRNHLNAIELQANYISELGSKEELKSESGGLRELVSGKASILKPLSRVVGEVEPYPIPYTIVHFLECF